MGECKRHLGITDAEHDTDLLDLIQAATNVLVRSTGRAMLTTQYRLKLPCFRDSGWLDWPIDLPFPPLINTEAKPVVVNYYDTAGALQTLPGGDVQIIERFEVNSAIRPGIGKSWPAVQDDRADAVQIEYWAGYGDSSDLVPPEAKQFVKLLVRHWYDNPSAVITGTISKEIELAAASLRRSLGTGYYANV